MFRKLSTALMMAASLMLLAMGVVVAFVQPQAVAAASDGERKVSAIAISINEPVVLEEPVREPLTSYSYPVVMDHTTGSCNTSKLEGITSRIRNKLCEVTIDRAAWPYTYGLSDPAGVTTSSTATHMTVQLKMGFIGVLYLSNPEAAYLDQQTLPTEVQRWSFMYRPGATTWQGPGLNHQYIHQTHRLLQASLSTI